MQVADEMCRSLSISDDRRELTRLVALVHDIGHGPFSHLFEEVLKRINGDKFSHEFVTSWLLKDDGDIANAIGENQDDAQKLLPTNEDESSFPLLREVISSGIDGDKLDYLRRDSYHIGVAYGAFDLNRILHTLSSTPDNQHLCILEKGKDAVENYRLGRYLMHAQVYEHRTRIITDEMFLRSLELSFRDGAIQKSLYKIGTADNAFLTANHSKFVENYGKLTDDSMMDEILSQAKGNAKLLAEGLMKRRLLKCAIEIDPALDVPDALIRKAISELDRNELRTLEADLAKKVQCDPELVIAHLQQMTIKLYDPYDILIKRSNGRILTIEQASPISASAKPIVKLFVFCPGEFRGRMRTEVCKRFKLSEDTIPN